MERMALYLVAALLIGFPGSSYGGLYTLITPGVLRTDTEEQILVEAHGDDTPKQLTIIVYDFPRKQKTLFHTTVDMNPAGGMLVTPTIKIPAKLLDKESRQNQYVVVQVTGLQGTLEKVVLISYQSGFVFIQTDKGIYTPGSPVRYRVFSMDHNMHRMDKTVIVEFQTPEGIVVSSSLVDPASPLLIRPYNLPELVSFGTWKVVAKYEHSPEESYTAYFDVREYVLPSIEVHLQPSENFLYIDGNTDFQVSITARFLHGKKVEGVAFALFGVKVDGDKKSIPDSLTRIPIIDGEGKATLNRDTLGSRFQDLNELVGHTLYVSVTVITESGSDMVVTEQSGIHIVTTPYQISFRKTPKYCKPGMPYELMVYVTNPDGSPAAKVPVVSEPIHSEGTTLSDGTAKLILNTPVTTQSLQITVRTNRSDLPRERQATKSMTVTAYQTQGGSGNYLHVAIGSTEIKSGDNLLINFNVKGNADSLNQIKYFTYLILTKGKIFKVGRQPKGIGQNLVIMTLRITPDLIPSFRFVAYFQVGNNEIVADSVWVDVKDTCMGTLVVKSDSDNQIQEPGAAMEIKLEGDPGARVGLVVVDKAVYVLNDKYKISQAKIWDTIEKSDFGCTAGSGQNNLGVFEDAGLALTTSTNLNTKQRSDAKCPQPANRRRRSSVLLLDSKASKVAQFQDQELRKCCEDGMHENPMGYSCEKRTKYIQEGDACKAAFLECCNYIKGIRDKNQRENELFLAKSDLEDEFFGNGDINSRTEFPESWLWHTEFLPEEPNSEGISSKTVSFRLKDSITTWEVLAVSITPTKGICVAEPYEITVMKYFFIDLRLPYSVVKNEQVEVRAVLYNYAKRDINVAVELLHNPAFCSPSTERKRYREQFTIKSLSSRTVPFVIIPLQQGLHDIEVIASVRGQWVSDGVKKKLKVVPDGERKSITTVIQLDPSAKGLDGTQREVVKARKLDDKVPDTEIETKITIHGDRVAQIIENSIDGNKLIHLIITPSGCGEQNMILMTAPVIATYYLDATGQWETLGVDRRKEAAKQIMTGYAQQMVYKNANHSYAAFTNRAPSTWLTAYVEKVFALATKIVNEINHDILCGGVRWLILNRQKLDGAFFENAPVIHGEMLGGILGAEPEESLTAFVLVALLESRSICKDHINSLDSSINKATDYLLKKYNTLQRPYTTALTAYALAAAGRLNDDRVLMAASTGGNRWEEYNAHTYNIEGTSYALLALLKMKKFDEAGPVVRWLTDQKFYEGTYGQTQATVMVFQALAEYEIQVPTYKIINLKVVIRLPGRELPIKYVIDTSLRAETTETKLNEAFTVSASGDGNATMTILTVYNAQLREEANVCNKFHLNVSVENVQLDFKQSKGAKGALKLKICTRYLGDVDSTMAIIDVSMLTGFLPDAEDLKTLSEGVDRYISKFEIDNNMAQKGNVIIYLDKVSHSEDECLQFKILKHFEVGFIQPGSVKVYSYYNLDEQCTKFYSPDKGTGLLSKICHDNICRCAEETCSLLNQQEGIDFPLRIKKACEPNVDYVYKAKLLRIEEKDGNIFYVMKVLQVIKAGTDRNPRAKPRQYISQRKCQEALNLKVNDDYLIWGLSSDLWPMNNDFSYLITKDTWIERWPHENECQDEEFQDLCDDFAQLTATLTIYGCPN